MTISLKAARVNAGLSQSDVAEKLGVTQVAVAHWESGRCRIAAVTFMKLCDIYNMLPTEVKLPAPRGKI